MGTAGAGPLVRYVLERQAIVNPADPIGSLNPSGWTNDPNEVYTNPTNAATVTVGPDTCIRLHTIFGAPPSTTSQTVANCRVGQCGDLGYDVASPPSCLGGPLVSESPIELKAIRERAGAVAITWKASAELTTTSYRVEAVSKKGSALLGTVPATETGTGTSASYKFTATATQLKGVRTIEVTAIPSGAKQRVQIQ
jgi:hypothetical protein